MQQKKAPTDQSSTQGQWGLPEDIMKVRGNQTIIMPWGRLAKARKICQWKSGAETPLGSVRNEKRILIVGRYSGYFW